MISILLSDMIKKKNILLCDLIINIYLLDATMNISVCDMIINKHMWNYNENGHLWREQTYFFFDVCLHDVVTNIRDVIIKKKKKAAVWRDEKQAPLWHGNSHSPMWRRGNSSMIRQVNFGHINLLSRDYNTALILILLSVVFFSFLLWQRTEARKTIPDKWMVAVPRSWVSERRCVLTDVLLNLATHSWSRKHGLVLRLAPRACPALRLPTVCASSPFPGLSASSWLFTVILTKSLVRTC